MPSASDVVQEISIWSLRECVACSHELQVMQGAALAASAASSALEGHTVGPPPEPPASAMLALTECIARACMPALHGPGAHQPLNKALQCTLLECNAGSAHSSTLCQLCHAICCGAEVQQIYLASAISRSILGRQNAISMHCRRAAVCSGDCGGCEGADQLRTARCRVCPHRSAPADHSSR